MYLSCGVGTIVLCDSDIVDPNLQRQILHVEESVGLAKVISGARSLTQLNPHVRSRALAFDSREVRLKSRLHPQTWCWTAATTLPRVMP